MSEKQPVLGFPLKCRFKWNNPFEGTNSNGKYTMFSVTEVPSNVEGIFYLTEKDDKLKKELLKFKIGDEIEILKGFENNWRAVKINSIIEERITYEDLEELSIQLFEISKNAMIKGYGFGGLITKPDIFAENCQKFASTLFITLSQNKMLSPLKHKGISAGVTAELKKEIDPTKTIIPTLETSIGITMIEEVDIPEEVKGKEAEISTEQTSSSFQNEVVNKKPKPKTVKESISFITSEGVDLSKFLEFLEFKTYKKKGE